MEGRDRCATGGDQVRERGAGGQGRSKLMV